MIYLLTAIGLPPGGSSTVHIYTQTIHRMTQNKQYIEQHKNFGRMRGRAPSLRVITWHLPYNWGKSMENNQRQEIFLSSKGTVAHAASYSMCTVGSSPQVKQQGYPAEPAPPSIAEFKNEQSHTSIRFHAVHRNKSSFTFTFRQVVHYTNKVTFTINPRKCFHCTFKSVPIFS